MRITITREDALVVKPPTAAVIRSRPGSALTAPRGVRSERGAVELRVGAYPSHMPVPERRLVLDIA